MNLEDCKHSGRGLPLQLPMVLFDVALNYFRPDNSLGYGDGANTYNGAIIFCSLISNVI